MRLGPLEIFILSCFREHCGERLSVWDIIGKSTDNRHKALIDAIEALASEHQMLARVDRAYELTELGRKYLSAL